MIRALLAAPEKLDGAQRLAIEEALVRLVVTTMDRDDAAAGKA